MPGKISVIIPAYNEEDVIAEVVVKALGQEDVLDVIVVNDGSTDKTAENAAEAGARVVTHPYNMGNGAAVKSGIRAAAGEILVLMDGDGQHDPEDIGRLVAELDKYHMVIGARDAGSHAGWPRLMANRLYNRFASYVARQRVEDLTSGFRALRAKTARQFLYLLPNGFSAPTTFTLSLMRAGYPVAFLPITCQRRVGVSKIKTFEDGLRFLLIIAKIATLFSPFRVFLPISLLATGTGVIYGVCRIILYGRYSMATILLIGTGVLVFLMGLISEQIASLRMQQSEGRRGHEKHE
ncbi:MAG: glycosyltransferase family 2 protein [Phycisphaerae bacterium]|nr:glycosyltransferase family 2 protein [Phycisphaerae bacterium]